MRFGIVLASLLSLTGCLTGGTVPLDEPASDPRTRPPREDVGETPAEEEDAPEDTLPSLVVTDVRAASEDGAFDVAPGESVVVEVRLVNPTDLDHFDYPSLRLRTDPPMPGAHPDLPYPVSQIWYGLFGRSSAEAQFSFRVPEDTTADSISIVVEYYTLEDQATVLDAAEVEIGVR